MTTQVLPLVRLEARHAYYGDGPPPLTWAPLAETAARLRQMGAVVRASGPALVVGVPVAPADPGDPGDPGSPLVLARGRRGDVFRFALLPTDGAVAAVTEGPGWRPGRTALALDNLRDTPDAPDRPDDAVLGAEGGGLGPFVALATGPALPVAPAVSGPGVVLRDRWGAAVAELAPEAPLDALPLDGLPGPGLYRAEVPARPDVPFLYAPSLRGRAPLAVASVFAAVPGPAAIPAAARVLDGEAPLGRRLWAALPARATRWRYVLAKTSGAAGAPLAAYAVEPVGDGPALAAGAPGVFTTAGPVAWQHAPAQVRLTRAAAAVRPLPNPGPQTPLVDDGGAVLAVHHVYV